MKKYNGELLFQISNELGTVEVVDGPQLRTLHFGNSIIQSSMYRCDPYALEMEYCQVILLSLLFNPFPQKALFLGLGGGSQPKFLWKYFPSCLIDCVEYNPLVIDVCYRFFELPQDTRLTIHCEEAFQFLKQHQQQLYDFIFIDLYVEEGMSKTMGDPDFFKACFYCLREGGVLVWNLWRTSAQELIEQSVHHLTTYFGRNLLILTVQESLNFIVYAFKPPVPILRLQEAYSRLESLSQKTGMDFVKLFSNLNQFQGCGFLFQDWIMQKD